MIYSIGYQRLTPAELVATLDALRIDRLIDVRSVPSSRKRGFSRAALTASIGDRYAWHGDTLGGKGDGPTLEGLDMLRRLDARRERVMLMCLEQAPGECHRFHRIALPLSPMIDVQHVYIDVVVGTLELYRAVHEGREYAYETIDDIAERLGAERSRAVTP